MKVVEGLKNNKSWIRWSICRNGKVWGEQTTGKYTPDDNKNMGS